MDDRKKMLFHAKSKKRGSAERMSNDANDFG